MEGLFNKVVKGQFDPIPKVYSQELFNLVKYLIKVNPDHRPDCGQILSYPAIKAKIDLLFPPNYTYPTESTLLKTIKFPKTNQFSVSLPEANYKNETMKLHIKDEPILT